ncbi:MAG: YgjV family protein [Clostridia bacterium]|nr:YgjV family protein [Clostridia bacterium]MBR2296004.1 YgjV family protein [Clostridia bacterium]
MEILAQAFGIVGMIFNIIVFQQRKQKNVLIFQFLAALTFALNYLLLGAMVGGLLNIVGALRALVFFFEEKTHAREIPWLVAFIVMFSASYPLTFLVFDTPVSTKSLIIEVLPVIAMIVATISLRLGKARAVRAFGLISSPLWLIYNCFSGSIGAVASEILNLISIIVGIVRLDIKKENREKQE